MPNSLNESIPLIHLISCGGWLQVRVSDVALNSLLWACLSLKLPLSCSALKQLECMAKLRESF